MLGKAFTPNQAYVEWSYDANSKPDHHQRLQ